MVAALSATTSSGDELAPALAAIEELAEDFGQRCVVSAIMRSSCADALGKIGTGSAVAVTQAVLRQIVSAKDSKMEAEIICMAIGLVLDEGMTVTRLAKRYGCTKQAISKRIVTFCEKNALPPSIYMRPEKDRAIYALCNQPRIA